jgi:hypothetical protein
MERVQFNDQESGPDAPEATLVEPSEEAVQQQEETQPEPDRPDWLADKFSSPEDMAKAYANLEKKFSSRQAEEKGLLTDADFAQYNEEFAANGGLTDKSYDALGAKGLSRDLVDNYIRGQTQLQDTETNDLMSVAGGAENYQQMSAWMSENLPQEELDAFNESLEGSAGMAKMAIKGMFSQWNAAGGEGGEAEPNLFQGGRTASEGGYGSMYDMQQDMKNPLYKAGDTKFHAMVDRRLAISGDLS